VALAAPSFPKELHHWLSLWASGLASLCRNVGSDATGWRGCYISELVQDKTKVCKSVVWQGSL